MTLSCKRSSLFARDQDRSSPRRVLPIDFEEIQGRHGRVGRRAAARDMPGYRIQQHTRHKSAEMVAGYIRQADKWTKSGLKGVGF